MLDYYFQYLGLRCSKTWRAGLPIFAASGWSADGVQPEILGAAHVKVVLSEMERWDGSQVLHSRDRSKTLSGLAAQLRSCKFTESEVVRLLGLADIGKMITSSVLYAYVTFEQVPILTDGPAGILAQLFVRNGRVPTPRYTEVLPAEIRQSLEFLDLIDFGEGLVASRASILPYSSTYILSDQLFSCLESPDQVVMSDIGDFVMPPHASSLILLDNVAQRGGSLLDIGCGSGFLALLLASQHELVVGIDINPRAVEYAQCNAMLNSCSVSFANGDIRIDAPIDERFEQVIFNAPISSPHRTRAIEVGAMGARQVVTDMAAKLPKLLVPGGLAQILVSVEVPGGSATALTVVEKWLQDDAGNFSSLEVREIFGTPLGVSAAAIEKSQIDPGCLLVDGREDSAQLISYLQSRGTSRVTPVVVSIGL